MSSMEYVKLKDYCSSVRDGTHDTPKQTIDGMPLVTSKAINNNEINFDQTYNISQKDFDLINKRSLVEKWDVLMTMIGSVGRMLIVKNDPNYAIKNVALFKIGNEERAKWLYYYFNLPEVQKYMELIASGTSQHFIPLNQLRKFKIVDYHYNSKKIIVMLNNYDQLIENNNKRIKLLEQASQELYNNCFSYEKISRSAKEIRLSEIITISRGISYSSDEIDVSSGSNLINLKNIQSFGGFRRNGTKLYSGKYKNNQVVSANDLVMGVTDMTQDRRTVGSVALIPTIPGISVISADLIKIESDIPTEFLYCMFKYGNVSRYISQFANGANVLHLKPDSVKKVKVLIPRNDLINSFVNIVKPIIMEIDFLNMKNDNLIKQRDLLLPRLMSGKLEVK